MPIICFVYDTVVVKSGWRYYMVKKNVAFIFLVRGEKE